MEWQFEHSQAVGAITIELVRGSVQLVRRPGPIRIQALISARTSDPRRVSLELTRHGSGLRLRDIYPPSRTPFSECLPPDDGRGDFWSSDARVTVLVHVPASVRVTEHVMERAER